MEQVVPPFRPGAHLSDLHDLSTFRGRWRYNWDVLSPYGLQWGHEAVAEANAVLASRAQGQPIPDADCWHATRVRAAAAPAGELLFLPFRGCGWALGNTPTIAFMVVSALRHPTCIRRIAFGQWLNQTHLAGATWCNRGASDDSGDGGPSSAAIFASYVAALAVAIPIGVGGGWLCHRSKLLAPLSRFAPYPAVALANCMGTLCMRSTDMTRGIPVKDPAKGPSAEPIGLSQVAGVTAVRDTCVTRMLMPVGNFILVPAAVWLYTGVRRMRQPSLIAQVLITAAIFTVWLPTATAVYPPLGAVPMPGLESHLRDEAEVRAKREGLPLPNHVEYQRGV
eukprot:m.15004 g.15004  ORF g.15004 m.15004 type:complete len:337 (-) comp4859_c0_seq1:185-1195(-)